MNKTFLGGTKVPHRKSMTESLSIEKMPLVNSVSIPLLQGIGAPAKACVEAGANVKVGQLIGEKSGVISANVYSSLSGTVKEIVSKENLSGTKCDHIVIESDGQDEVQLLSKIPNPTSEEIVKRAMEAGLIGMGGAGFPTSVKLDTKGKNCDMVIINAAECEPYITCDHRLMIERGEEMIKGAVFMAKAVSAPEVVIGIEENKMDAVEVLNGFCGDVDGIKVSVCVVKARYPQGAEKQLIYSVKKVKIPASQLPIDRGFVVSNVHTAICLYEALVEGKPCYERAMTVSGKGINTPKNIMVKNGTSIQDLIDYCGGVNDDTVKVINGGPLTGNALNKLDYFMTKCSNSILFMLESETDMNKATACISCGKCATVCPMKMLPMQIDSSAIAKDYKACKAYHVESCISCGCCAFVCPAKRPLLQSFKLARKMIKERNI